MWEVLVNYLKDNQQITGSTLRIYGDIDDDHGNIIKIEIYKKDGTLTDYTTGTFFSEMDSGDYYCKATCGKVYAIQNFKVVSYEEQKNNAISLNPGMNSITAGYDNFYFYHISADKETAYTLQWENGGYFFLLKRTTNETDYQWEIVNDFQSSPFAIKLKAGEEYYLYWQTYQKMDVPDNLQISEKPVVTEITCLKNDKPQFLNHLESNYLNGITVQISYENEESQILDLGNTRYDSFGNYITYSVYNENQEVVSEYYLDVGTYYLGIYPELNPETKVMVPFEVVDPKEAIADEIKIGEEKIFQLELGDFKWCKITPEESGSYFFDMNRVPKSNSPFTYYNLYNEAGERLYLGNYCYNLEGGKTYFLNFTIAGDMQVSAKVLQRKQVKEIEVIPGTQKYWADHSQNHFRSWKFRFKYADDTYSEEFYYGKSDSYNHTPYARVTNENGESIYNYDYASEGKYTVEFYCEGITSSKFEFEQIGLQQLSQNLNLDSSVTIVPGESVYLSYHVPEGASGYYNFIVDKNVPVNMAVYYKQEAGNDYYQYYGAKGNIYNLKADTTYYFVVEPDLYRWEDGMESGKVMLSKVSEWDFLKDSLTIQGNTIAYTITPPKTSKYDFVAKNQVTGAEEYVSVELSSGDETYISRDSLLNAGQQYLIIFYPSNSVEDACTITAKQIVSLTGVEVFIDNSDSVELVEYLSALDATDPEIKINAIYSDDTKEEVPYTGYRYRYDSKRRHYYISLRDGNYLLESTDDLPAGTYTLMVEMEDEWPYITGSCEIIVKSIKEVTEKYGEALSLGTEQKLVKMQNQPAAYYSFTPEETGKYEFEFSDLVEKLVVTDKNNKRITNITTTDTGLQLSLKKGQTYYFAAVGGPVEKTVSVKRMVAVTGIDLRVENADSYTAGIDSLKTQDIELNITYDNSETATIRGGEEDAYGNYFRLKASWANGNMSQVNNLRTGGSISLHSGDYAITARVRNEKKEIGSTTISVAKLNLDAFQEVKIGEAFDVKGGREFFKVIPESDGKYYVSQKPSESTVTINGYDELWEEVYTLENLKAGETYLIQCEGSAGKVQIDKGSDAEVKEVKNVSIDNTVKAIEYLDTGAKYLENLPLIIEYVDGTKEFVEDGSADSYGHYFWRSLKDSSGNWVGSREQLSAGEYILEIHGTNFEAEYPVNVCSIKEEAEKQMLAPEKTAVVTKSDNFSAMFFAYKAEKSGRHELVLDKAVNEMIAVDENGNLKSLAAEGTHYTFSLKENETAYFAVNTDYSVFTAKVKACVDVESVELQINKTYYYGSYDDLYPSDIQLTVKYADNTTQLVKATGSKYVDSYGNAFRFRVKQGRWYNQLLSGSGIGLYSGEYIVRAYVSGKVESVGKTTIKVKDVVLEELPELSEGEAFEVEGTGGKELFRFTPKTDGWYDLQNSEDGSVAFREKDADDFWIDVKSDALKAGHTYLVIYKGTRNQKEILVKKGNGETGNTSTGGILELGKSYDVSIAKEDDYVYFTYIPEESGMYCLESEFGNGVQPVFYLYKGYKKVYDNYSSLSYELIAGIKYTFKVGCAQDRIGTYKIMLSEYHKPSKIVLRDPVTGSDTVLGVAGQSTPETLLYKQELSISYTDNETQTLNYLWEDENRDEYGNIYEFSITEEGESERGKEYLVTATCGQLQATMKLIIVPKEAIDSLKLNEAKVLSFAQMGDWQQMYYQFVPDQDGYYDPSVTGDCDTSIWYLENSSGKKVTYNNNQRGYFMKAGASYYLRLNWKAVASGNLKVAVKNANPLKSMELIKEPKTSYCAYPLIPAQMDGAVLKVTFADGRTETIDSSDEDVVATGRFLNDKKYLITYEYCGFSVEYEVPSIGLEELPVISEQQSAEAEFNGNAGAETRIFRIQVTQNGRFKEVVEGADEFTCTLYSSDLKEMQQRESYQLKTDRTYYMLVKLNETFAGKIQVGLNGGCEHKYQLVIDKEATCGEDGSQHEECSICHAKKASTVIPATGNHNYQTIVDIAATCGSAGSQHEECTVCHTQKAATAIPATGQHQYVEVTDTIPTCGSTGTQHKECSICHTRENAETVAATGNHKFTTIVDRAATCGAAGSQHEECTVCHARKEAKAIPATGNHKFKTVVDRAATCGAAGSQHQECTVCHTKKETKAIPATGKHSYGAYKTVKAATIYAAGKEERKCSVCGTKQSRTVRKLTAKISVAAKSTSVVVGSRVTAPKVTYANGDRISSWKTSNKAVATVDKYGRITGKKAGTAIITVTLKSKKYARIKVTVKKKVAAVRVKLNRTSLTLKRGASFQLRATVTPRNTTDTVTYKTSNKNIVSVSSKGKLVAKKRGKATITVIVGKKKASCRVVVK